MKKTILGTLAYTVFTFILAVLWHVILFEEQYKTFGYFDGKPNFLMGLFSIFIQGLVLTYLFNFVRFSGSSLTKCLKYAGIVGLFLWTSHVIAFVAKQNVINEISFIAMESFYLMLQFGVYGLMLHLIYRNSAAIKA